MSSQHSRGEAPKAPPNSIKELILADDRPFDLDWSVSPSELSVDDRLQRLAHIKAILPEGNAEQEGPTHDKTLENYIKLALLTAGDRRILSQYIDIVSEILEADDPRIADLAQQALWIWGPAAEVAGLYEQKTALEDKAFATLLPEEYAKIKSVYDREAMQGENGPLQAIADNIKRLVATDLPEGQSFEISYRSKSYYSVWRKLQQDGKTHANIFDLLGIRLIIDDTSQDPSEAAGCCYLALSAAVRGYQSDGNRLKDYIEDPKPNGYQSLHATLNDDEARAFELQIRTSSMHDAAENDDLMSHQGYDATKAVPGKIPRVYRKVPKLYKWRDLATRLISEANGSTAHVLDGEILFFRTDGNLYSLPNNPDNPPTYLDASFRVHSRRALRTKTVTAGVDHKPVRLGDLVKFGDVLNIAYANDEPTSPAELAGRLALVGLVSSERVIQKALRSFRKPELIEAGTAFLLEHLAAEIPSVDDVSGLIDRIPDTVIRQLVDGAGVKSFKDLLALIASDPKTAKPRRIARAIITGLRLMPKDEGGEIPPQTRDSSEISHGLLDMITIPGIEPGDTDVRIADCCTGCIKIGQTTLVARPTRSNGGFSIHTSDCVNVSPDKGVVLCRWRD